MSHNAINRLLQHCVHLSPLRANLSPLHLQNKHSSDLNFFCQTGLLLCFYCLALGYAGLLLCQNGLPFVSHWATLGYPLQLNLKHTLCLIRNTNAQKQRIILRTTLKIIQGCYFIPDKHFLDKLKGLRYLVSRKRVTLWNFDSFYELMKKISQRYHKVN